MIISFMITASSFAARTRCFDPAALTNQIKHATTIELLLRTHSAHLSQLDHIHLPAFQVSRGRLITRSSVERRCLKMKDLEPLVRQTLGAIKARQVDARMLSNVAHGATKCGKGAAMGDLFVALAWEIEQRLHQFNAQEMANTA